MSVVCSQGSCNRGNRSDCISMISSNEAANRGGLKMWAWKTRNSIVQKSVFLVFPTLASWIVAMVGLTRDWALETRLWHCWAKWETATCNKIINAIFCCKFSNLRTVQQPLWVFLDKVVQINQNLSLGVRKGQHYGEKLPASSKTYNIGIKLQYRIYRTFLQKICG